MKLRWSESEPCGSAEPVGVGVAVAWSTFREGNINIKLSRLGNAVILVTFEVILGIRLLAGSPGALYSFVIWRC